MTEVQRLCDPEAKEKVEKRRPDGSTYEATRSVRVSKRTGKDL